MLYNGLKFLTWMNWMWQDVDTLKLWRLRGLTSVFWRYDLMFRHLLVYFLGAMLKIVPKKSKGNSGCRYILISVLNRLQNFVMTWTSETFTPNLLNTHGCHLTIFISTDSHPWKFSHNWLIFKCSIQPLPLSIEPLPLFPFSRDFS